MAEHVNINGKWVDRPSYDWDTGQPITPEPPRPQPATLPGSLVEVSGDDPTDLLGRDLEDTPEFRQADPAVQRQLLAEYRAQGGFRAVPYDLDNLAREWGLEGRIGWDDNARRARERRP